MIGNPGKTWGAFFGFSASSLQRMRVISWQSAFLWMHLHCQALAYTIKRSLLATQVARNWLFHQIPHRTCSSVATCNVVNNPRDLSSMAIYHVRSTRNVNMPPHPTPLHPTIAIFKKRAFYGNGFRSAGINMYIHIDIYIYTDTISILSYLNLNLIESNLILSYPILSIYPSIHLSIYPSIYLYRYYMNIHMHIYIYVLSTTQNDRFS